MTETEIRILLGQNLKFFRKKRNFSQMQLAEEVGLTFNFINDIENGKKWISPSTLSKISSALNIQPYHLFLPVQNLHQNYSNETLSMFSNDILGQFENILHETLERYK